MFKKIIVGLSGGIDSAVSALLLKSKGFEVTAVFMKNWDTLDESGKCQAETDLKDCELICDKLKIPLMTVDFVKEYWNEVFNYTITEYQNGNTPHPDIRCNKYIKFDAFYNYACKQLGADAISTGHYVQTSFGAYLEHYKPDANVALLRAKDLNKDQTIFLSQVSQNALRKCMFPVGNLYKNEVKEIAKNAGFDTIVAKKESMGICFIGKRNFQSFINEYVEPKEGPMIDLETGKEVGTHNGIHQWTLGQRCSIGGLDAAYFACAKHMKSNTIFVVKSTDHPALMTEFVMAKNTHWINKEPERLSNGHLFDCDYLSQHREQVTPCTVYKSLDNKLFIKLSRPLRAITAGQFAVLYSGSECLGSSEIEYSGPSYFILDKKIEDFSGIKRQKKYSQEAANVTN